MLRDPHIFGKLLADPCAVGLEVEELAAPPAAQPACPYLRHQLLLLRARRRATPAAASSVAAKHQARSNQVNKRIAAVRLRPAGWLCVEGPQRRHMLDLACMMRHVCSIKNQQADVLQCMGGSGTREVAGLMRASRHEWNIAAAVGASASSAGAAAVLAQQLPLW